MTDNNPGAQYVAEKYEEYQQAKRALREEMKREQEERAHQLLVGFSMHLQAAIRDGVPTGLLRKAIKTNDHGAWVKFRDAAGPIPGNAPGRPKGPVIPGTLVGGERKHWEIHDNRALILPSNDWNLDNEWWPLEEILFNSGKEVWVTHWDSIHAPITLTIAWDKYGFESLSKLQDGGEEWQEFSNAIVLFFKNNPDVKKELMKKLAVEK